MIDSKRPGVPTGLWIALAAAVLAAVLLLLGRSPEPRITITPAKPAIGRRTAVGVVAAEPTRGLVRVRVELQQGDRVEVLADRSYPHRGPLALWGPRTERDTIDVDVGRDVVRGLKAGPAAVRVTADRGARWFRRPEPVVASITLPVRLTPPSLELQSTQVYAAQGGCEAVVYRVGDSSVRDGVRVGEWWFPGFAVPGGPARNRFALFAVPYDQAAPAVRLVASDDAGNEAEIPFVEKFFPKPFRSDRLELGEAFMRKVVPEIIARTPDFTDRGGLLENYLAINGELRQENAAELRELSAGSRPEFLWSKPFVRMPNSQPMASFADRRTYVLDGREVDRQDHLGFDLAVTRQAPVPAANRGRVLLARYFGIYGNTVVLDHGYGLTSLYGHLSSIAVKPGQRVEAGESLGRTGETGLAGGDHLHFAILLQGLPVNPVEWWDGHWIRDRLARKLGPALPFTP